MSLFFSNAVKDIMACALCCIYIKFPKHALVRSRAKGEGTSIDLGMNCFAKTLRMNKAREEPRLSKVVFYYPKSKRTRNFSIVFLFDDVRKNLPPIFMPVVYTPKYTSNGVWKRLVNTVDAAFHQGNVNHITGDVHFPSLLLKRHKTVLTIHDCIFMHHPSKLHRLFYKWFWLLLPIRCSRYITVVSESTKREVIKYSGCSPQKIFVIPNFVSKRYTYQPKPFNSNKPVILHIGVADNKNLDRLVHALEGLNCELRIIGKLKPKHVSLLSYHKIEYEAFFDLSAEEILRQYVECDLVSFASTYEGFGLPILEAQSVGRPVVTGTLYSMPEVAGEGACFVNPYSVQDIRNGILHIINDETYRSLLIGNGLKNIQRFSCEAAIEQYMFLYSRICYPAN